MKVLTQKNTRKNNALRYQKPNEDYTILDDSIGFYMVLDGVTRHTPKGYSYPNPSPTVRVVRILANTIYQHILASTQMATQEKLSEAVKEGNKAVLQHNQKQYPNAIQQPGAVGIVGILKDSIFHYAHLGDCMLLLVRNNKMTQLTQPQTAELAKHKKSLKAADIWKNITNNMNHPYRYGVYNGDERVLPFVEYNRIELQQNDTLIIASDGLEYLFKHKNIINLLEYDFESWFDWSEALEQQYGYRSDDKTIITIQIQ